MPPNDTSLVPEELIKTGNESQISTGNIIIIDELNNIKKSNSTAERRGGLPNTEGKADIPAKNHSTNAKVHQEAQSWELLLCGCQSRNRSTTVAQLPKQGGLSGPKDCFEAGEFSYEMFLTSPEDADKLAQLIKSAYVPYDKTNAMHEKCLMELWDLAYPSCPLDHRISEQWKQLGFQGCDPATDFRGAGFFGLQNLLYFARHRQELFTDCALKGRDYGLAVAAMNATSILRTYLGIRERGTKAEYLTRKYVASKASLKTFASFLKCEAASFNSIFCAFMTILDSQWRNLVSTDPKITILDFQKALDMAYEELENIMRTHPSCLETFDMAVSQRITITACDTSKH